MDGAIFCENHRAEYLHGRKMIHPSTPLVSICIPTYNRPNQLNEALRSCLDQDYSNIEIIVTDNSNNDQSRLLVEGLKDDRIHYFKNSENVGPNRNLNACLLKGGGKYLKVLMDDDLLLPTALSEMVSAMEENPSVGVVMAPLYVINDKSERISFRAYLLKRVDTLYQYQSQSGLISGKKILIDFMTRAYPCCVPSGVLYRKECFNLLGGIDTAINFCDVDIAARFATKYDFYYINKPLSCWRYSQLSFTVTNIHKNGESTEEYYYLTKKFIEDPLVRILFTAREMQSLEVKSYFFASKRAMLSILAGIQGGSPSLVWQTLKLMWKNDPHKRNFALLPFNLFREVVNAGFSWLK